MRNHFLRLSVAVVAVVIIVVLGVGQAGRLLAQNSGLLYTIVKDGKWGFIDAQGNIVIDPQYDYAYDFYEANAGVTWVQTEGKWELINQAGKVVLPQMFTDTPRYANNALPSYEGSQYFYADATTGLATVFQAPDTLFVLGQYDAVHHVDNSNLFAVRHNQKWGYVDQSGKVVVDLKYDDAFPWFEEELLVVSQNKLYGFIDAQGNSITPIQFQSLHPFSEGLAAVKMDGKWGYIDKNGTMVRPAIYETDRNFHEGVAGVKIGDKWGFIDTTGKLVIPATFENVSDFEDGVAWAATGKKWGMIDHQGTFVIEPKFDTNIPPDDNLYFSYGYTTIPYPFMDDAAPIRFGGAPMFEGPFGKAGLIDRTGAFLLPAEYDNVCYAGAQLFGIKKDDKWGLVDHLGKVIMEPIFEDSLLDGQGCRIAFSGDRARVRLDGKYGYIDTTGIVVIQPKYDNAQKFNGALAKVFIQQGNVSLMGYVDMNGNEVWPPSQ